jgi:hypothetical protein
LNLCAECRMSSARCADSDSGADADADDDDARSPSRMNA